MAGWEVRFRERSRPIVLNVSSSDFDPNPAAYDLLLDGGKASAAPGHLDYASRFKQPRLLARDLGWDGVKMTAIQYLNGDATSPQVKGNKVIAHICNDLGGWGKGFVLAVSRHWQEPELDYRKWHRERADNDFGLGAVRFIQVEPYIWVANMIGQRGMKTGSKGPPIRYEAVRECLEKLADFASEKTASVHMPRIGCGLAGGRWELILPIIESTLANRDVPVYVYDFAP